MTRLSESGSAMTPCRANVKASSCSIKQQYQAAVPICSITVQPCANASSWPKPEYMASKLLFGYMPYVYALLVKQHQQNSLLSIFFTHKCKCVELFPYESACLALSLPYERMIFISLSFYIRLPSLLRCCSCSSITLVLD